MEEVNSPTIYYKNFCKCHNVWSHKKFKIVNTIHCLLYHNEKDRICISLNLQLHEVLWRYTAVAGRGDERTGG
jgi:hypothetical protein